jgi:hypothetical protein
MLSHPINLPVLEIVHHLDISRSHQNQKQKQNQKTMAERMRQGKAKHRLLMSLLQVSSRLVCCFLGHESGQATI